MLQYLLSTSQKSINKACGLGDFPHSDEEVHGIVDLHFSGFTPVYSPNQAVQYNIRPWVQRDTFLDDANITRVIVCLD